MKPSKRDDLRKKVFRNLRIDSSKDLNKVKKIMENYLDAGVKFLASEIIPGNDDCIYAYVAYRDMNGKILNEWAGKKLTQYPDSFGVFASASNEAPEEVSSQVQIKNKKIHFIYLKYEIINLIRRKKHLRTLIRNIKNSDKIYFAVYGRQDIKPFLKDFTDMAIGTISNLLSVKRMKLTCEQKFVSPNCRFWGVNCVSDCEDDPENL